MSSLFRENLRNDLFLAYDKTRKNKRNTYAQLQFEKDVEHNLIVLLDSLVNQSYIPQPAMCFIIYDPVMREVFASKFSDRVVNQLLYNYISPIFEKKFIYDSYSCRKGKGILFGIKRLDHHIRSCTNNYRQMAYVLKIDIQGYFMNIKKDILYKQVMEGMHEYWEEVGINMDFPSRNPIFMTFLIKTIIFKDPTRNCIIKGDISEWKKLPKSKSLFNSPEGTGLIIGDVTSQLFSNIYLNVFDNMLKRNKKVKHYGRYVDDAYLVHTSKAFLKSLIPVIRMYLKNELGLTLHPRKIYLQPYTHGVPFLGAFVKPNRIYVVPRTIGSFHKKVNLMKNICEEDGLKLNEIKDIRAILNSYCGYFQHFKAYKIIHQSVTGSCIFKYNYFSSGYKKSIIYKRFLADTKHKTDINNILKDIFFVKND